MKLETFEYDGTIYTIKIGKSAVENTELVKNANKSDIWFHLSDSPSCHVVLTCEKKLNQVPRQVISRCAYLCKMHSKTSHNCKVIYTQIENVQITRTPGQVITGEEDPNQAPNPALNPALNPAPTCCKTI